ncbi:MAG: TolC family protein [Pseudomonadota bacterium]
MKCFLPLVSLLIVSVAHANAPLLPQTVARSTEQHYPEIVAAEAERAAARGRQLASRGAFDTVLETRGRARLDGFYSGDTGEISASRALRPLGAEVYGGYRVSQGDFPIYEDEYFTDQGGEVKIGVLFNLLRNRAIDGRRAGLREADIDVSAAELDVLLTQITVQQSALTAYWRWVARGRELKAYQDLLALAERRDDALRREVASGARARIVLTENAQNLTRRRELVRRAEQDLTLAANALSLFLRDALGEPIIPTADQLPETLPLPRNGGSVDAQALLTIRPDLQLLNLAQQRLEVQRDLARNDLQPELRVGVEAADDFGAIGPGGVSRDEREVIAGVTLSVPLGRRDARGRLRAAEAEITAVEQRQRLLRDQIVRELRDIIVSLETAEELLDLTRQETEQADALREAERSRFRSGASDFFLVNLREQSAANAQVRLAQAEFTLAAAALAYQAATLDLDRLRSGL